MPTTNQPTQGTPPHPADTATLHEFGEALRTLRRSRVCRVTATHDRFEDPQSPTRRT
jgi:hypothetical protein